MARREEKEYREIKYIKLNHARFMKRNFTGKAIPPYNPEGSRNFLVVIPDDMADELRDEGWPIKHTKPNPDYPEDDGLFYLQVQVGYAYNPPTIQRIIGDKSSYLNEPEVRILDNDRILDCKMILRSRYWGEHNEKIKAYLRDMKVTVAEDQFEDFMDWES